MVDRAGLLTRPQRTRIERLLADYERRTGHQVVLHTTPSLEGYAIEEYSILVAEAWKIGKKGKDDGVILTVAPNEREVMIAVGYGLEGELPDAVAARIVREYIVPHFKRGDLPGGMLAGLEQIMAVADGQRLGTRYLSMLEAPPRKAAPRAVPAPAPPAPSAAPPVEPPPVVAPEPAAAAEAPSAPEPAAAAPEPAVAPEPVLAPELERALVPEEELATEVEPEPRLQPIPWGEVVERSVAPRESGRPSVLFTLLWILVVLALFYGRRRFFWPFLGLPGRGGFRLGPPGGFGGGFGRGFGGGGGFRGGGGSFGGGGAAGRW